MPSTRCSTSQRLEWKTWFARICDSFAVENLGGNSGIYLTELSAGRGHIILSPIDLTSGLLNTNTWGILGYDPAYSQSLLKNLILWTLDGQKDEQQ